jgi:hypothetical protein
MEAAKAKATTFPRLVSLLVALMGCIVSALPVFLPLVEPAPLVLIGSGVAVVALGGFLFFSI